MDSKLILFIDSLPGPACIKDSDFKVFYCNSRYAEICNKQKKEIIGKTAEELFPVTDQAVQIFGHLKDDEELWISEKKIEREIYYYHQDSTAEIFLLQKYLLYTENGSKTGIGEYFRTITKLKRAEHEVKITESRLRTKEAIIQQKTQALQEIISNIEHERNKIKKIIQENMENFVFPILSKLKLKTESENIKFLDLLEDNLKEITDPFLTNTPQNLRLLSPRELEICNFLKKGSSSKEIANNLNISPQTIEKHRNNIRKKLALKRNISLVSYLKSGN